MKRQIEDKAAISSDWKYVLDVGSGCVYSLLSVFGSSKCFVRGIDKPNPTKERTAKNRNGALRKMTEYLLASFVESASIGPAMNGATALATPELTVNIKSFNLC